MTFEEANKRIRKHIKKYDEIDSLNYDLEKAFDLDYFICDMCDICYHQDECALREYMEEYEYDPVSRCKMWEHKHR